MSENQNKEQINCFFVGGNSEAFNNGRKSFFLGDEYCSNPYQIFSVQHDEWILGFKSAEYNIANIEISERRGLFIFLMYCFFLLMLINVSWTIEFGKSMLYSIQLSQLTVILLLVIPMAALLCSFSFDVVRKLSARSNLKLFIKARQNLISDGLQEEEAMTRVLSNLQHCNKLEKKLTLEELSK